MRVSLKAKLIAAFALVALIPGIASTIVGIRLLGERVVKQAQEKVSYDLNTARIIYGNRLSYVRTVALDTAMRFVTRDALSGRNSKVLSTTLEKTRKDRSLDFLGLVGADGKVISRAQNMQSASDSLAGDPVVRKCLDSGKATSGTVIMMEKRLLKEGGHLAGRARVEILPTPHAATRADKIETSGMVMEACVPVFDETGNLFGAVYCGCLLNGSHDIVDEVKETAYKGLTYGGKDIGTATIFQGDLRISTNVHLSDGSRAIGTRVSEEVNRRVLKEGGLWTGPAFVVNDWYLSAYEPIRDVEGTVIGMLYVGILQQKYSDLRRNTVYLFLFTAALGIIGALAAGYLLAVKISRPVSALALASRKLSKGDFSASVSKTSEDEIGDLEETFNAMALSIKERDENLKEETQRKLIQSEKLASIGRLAAGVAHQINNPLMSILIRSELLLRQAGNDSQREDLNVIISETNRCSQIVKGLLDFSRQSVPRKDSNDLNDIVSGAVSLLRTQAKVGDVQIREEYASGLTAITADQSQLREVLLNIALNSLDAMPDGGDVTFSTSSSKDGANLIISIEDTGTGIPPEHIQRLFDPFFTTKGRGKGTGLGLAVSYGIVNAHGGTIEVESTAGKGSKFKIILPVNPPAAGNPAEKALFGGQKDEDDKG